MPTFNFTQSSLPFSLNPVIRPPSLADQDEARIRRAIELARLRELEASPGFQERQIRLQERGAVDTERYRQDTTNLQQSEQGIQLRGQQVEQRGQDVQVRGQDILSDTQRRGQDLGAPAEKARALSELYGAGGAISPEEIHAYAVKLGLVEPPKAAEKPPGEFDAPGGPTPTPTATPIITPNRVNPDFESAYQKELGTSPTNQSDYLLKAFTEAKRNEELRKKARTGNRYRPFAAREAY